MARRFYEFYLPCLLTDHHGHEAVEWVSSKSDRLVDWIQGVREQFPGWSFDEVLCWDAEVA